MIESERSGSRPRASVLLASYNSERFISASIDSVLRQTYKDFEFIVIDDASTDSSFDILQEAEQRDHRIKVIRNERNLGLGASLAQGVEAACGDYLLRIDADDICFHDRLERQIKFLDEHPEVDILGGAAIEIDMAGKQGRIRKMPASHEEIMRSIWACPIIHPTVAFRRRRILAIGNYNATLRRRQDYELWFRCARQGLRFANLQDPLIYYRFDTDTHRRQPLSLALQQARIGLEGCRMLGLPWWQRVGVTLPVWRAVLPLRLQHAVYRALTTFDPRAR